MFYLARKETSRGQYTMPGQSEQFTISEQQNHEFAKLSGDYNPLHVNPLYSRRLQFGQPVVHGIHHLLRVWDAASLSIPSFPKTQPIEINATFPSPVSVDQTIEYDCQTAPDQLSVVLTAHSENKKILSLMLRYARHLDDQVIISLPDSQPQIESPIDQVFPPTHTSGTCQLCLDTSLANTLFPNLFKFLPSYRLAQILACTRVVGMRCPGLNSIFSRIKLEFHQDLPTTEKDCLRYSVAHTDARIGIIKLGIEAQNMKGALDTFFRPPPVVQPSFLEVSSKIDKEIFSTQRALVIGGSRGIGEVTAKILAAGGADVVLTYSNGHAEAECIADEITCNGKRCRVMQIDVTALLEENLAVFEGNPIPTHIYYFASPHISSNRVKIWDSGLFEKFSRFYLDAFSRIVNFFAEKAHQLNTPITFFYPSTVFIDQPENGFSEYAVAKGAGEVLCQQLAEKYQQARFVAPRLPRMSTDQTSSIIPIKFAPVIDVIYTELRKK